LDCSWLWGDDCKNMDLNACLCRAVNPKGKCRPCEYDTMLRLGAVSASDASPHLSPEVLATTQQAKQQAKPQPAMAGHHTGPMLVGTPSSDANATGARLQVLFCYMLVMPTGSELELVRGVREMRAGIYHDGCSGRRVYSSQRVLIAGDEFTEAAHEPNGAPLSMTCGRGTEWHLALNGRIFYNLWQYMLEVGEVFQYQWSAKVDADAVFLPQRLVPLLAGLEWRRAAFVNNCPFAGQYLHGPLEIVSREGFRKLRAGAGRVGGLKGCESMLSSTPTDREDWFLGVCLEKNGVEKVDMRVLSEISCPPFPKLGFACTTEPFKAAFHPYKDMTTWRACWSEATR